MTVLKILLITLCCLLVGSIAWSIVMGDPGAAPFVVIFSAPYGLPVLLVIAVSWALHDPQRTSWRKKLVLLVVCAFSGGVLMLILGPRDRGELPWIQADLIGGFSGGAIGAYLVTKWKRSP